MNTDEHGSQTADVQLIRDLCKRAHEASLELGEFREVWPKVTIKHQFVQSVYDDIEDAVEHLPGDWNGKVDWKAFRTLESYYLTHLDYVLLGLARSLDELQQCRQAIAARVDQARFTDREIEELVGQHFGEQ